MSMMNRVQSLKLWDIVHQQLELITELFKCHGYDVYMCTHTVWKYANIWICKLALWELKLEDNFKINDTYSTLAENNRAPIATFLLSDSIHLNASGSTMNVIKSSAHHKLKINSYVLHHRYSKVPIALHGVNNIDGCTSSTCEHVKMFMRQINTCVWAYIFAKKHTKKQLCTRKPYEDISSFHL